MYFQKFYQKRVELKYDTTPYDSLNDLDLQHFLTNTLQLPHLYFEYIREPATKKNQISFFIARPLRGGGRRGVRADLSGRATKKITLFFAASINHLTLRSMVLLSDGYSKYFAHVQRNSG